MAPTTFPYDVRRVYAAARLFSTTDECRAEPELLASGCIDAPYWLPAGGSIDAMFAGDDFGAHFVARS